MARTYYPFASRPTQVPASTMMIISLVCSVVVGRATASLAVALAAPVWACVIAGLVAGSGHIVGSGLIGNRSYRAAYRTHHPLRPTPAPPARRL